MESFSSSEGSGSGTTLKLRNPALDGLDQADACRARPAFGIKIPALDCRSSPPRVPGPRHFCRAPAGRYVGFGAVRVLGWPGLAELSAQENLKALGGPSGGGSLARRPPPGEGPGGAVVRASPDRSVTRSRTPGPSVLAEPTPLDMSAPVCL
jgi:hypothetical protein